MGKYISKLLMAVVTTNVDFNHVNPSAIHITILSKTTEQVQKNI